jgi:HAD superfamily hydrolase (TIGR01509 family)
MLRALCLDLMDTLVVDPYREALLAGTGLELAELRELRDPEAWAAFETAQIDEAEFARRFFSTAGGRYRLDLDAFNRARRQGYRPVEGMEDLLEATAGHLERYIATNYPVWVAEVVDLLGLAGRTDGVIASHDLGVRKPSPAFYAELLARVGHEPRACLFVDDRAENCAGARAAGMRAHLFTGAAGLRARLRQEGLPL